MQIKYINCDMCQSVEREVNSLEFRIQKIILKHQNNAVQELIKTTKEKVKGIKFNPADSSGKTREKKEAFLKALSGILIEEICYRILEKHNKNDRIKILKDDSKTSVNQIDLKIIKNWEKDNKNFTKEFTIEVRSSFPFKKIESIVCNEFDILGPYINNVKHGENIRDYYLRFLFSLEYQEHNFCRYGENNSKINYSKTTINTLLNDYFDDDFNLKKDLTVYFVGGATKEMMLDESISYIGNMQSETFNEDKAGLYKKIKIKNALDSISILRLILSVVDNNSNK